MKKLLLFFGFIFLIFSEKINAQTLIAGWDFQSAPGTVVLASAGGTPKLYNANVGSGVFYLDGSNGASNWATNELDGFGGSALNGGGATGLSTVTAGASSLALVNSSANGKVAVFKVNMTGYQNLIISYATRNTATGFNSQVWEYSTNGTTWNAVATITGLTTTFALKTLPSITGLSNVLNAYIRITFSGASNATGNNRLDNIQFNASNPASPTLTTSPTTLPSLNYFSGMGPSTAGSFILSGSTLTPLADNITVTAPTNFEISTTSATAGFVDNLPIAYTGGGFSSTIYARLKAGLADATYNGDVTFSGGGVSTPPTVALSGTVSPPVPTIALSPTSITGLTYVVGTGPSTGSAYSVSGMFLTPAADNISIVAPTNFEISTTLAGTYADNLLIPYTGNTLAATQIYARLKVGLAQNSYTGNIAHTGGGVATAVNEAVSGVVTSVGTGACGTSTPIGTARASADGTVITIQGRLSVDTEFGPNLIYIQDGNGTAGTGGIAIYFAAGNAALGSTINAGDEVQVTGALTTYLGKKEIANPTCFVKTSAPNQAVTPFVVTIADINIHEGELIKVENATVGDESPAPATATTKFLGSKNYTFSTSAPVATKELRIDQNTLLPNTVRPTTVTSVTGVVDHFVNTGGTINIYQIFPRDVDDIPGTTGGGGGAGACTALGFATVPVAQTLEVTNWNVEWLGNTTGGARPLGPTNEAQQMTNVMTVLNTLQSDVYCIEEVCDHPQFIARVGTDMPGYGVKCSTTYYSHFFDDPEIPGDGTSYAQKVCFVYKTAIVTPINAETTALLSDVYTYPPGNNWASGRLPYMFVADVTVNGITKKINFVGLHAKSGADVASYNRRKQDCIDMKTKLDSAYPNDNLIILGDYNDDLDASINVGQPSTYANFVSDNTNYVQISKSLSDCGVSSTAKYSDIIDHFMASNEFGILPVTGTPPAVPSSGIYYLENTVNVARPITYVPSYTTSTSDHYPVTARFSFGIPTTTAPATITSTTTGNWSAPTTWDCNCVPTSASDVIINTGNTVTVDATSQAKSLNVKGILNWVAAFTLTLGM